MRLRTLRGRRDRACRRCLEHRLRLAKGGSRHQDNAQQGFATHQMTRYDRTGTTYSLTRPRYLSASYRDNSRKSQPSICGGLLAELSADKNTMRDPACVLCGHVAMVAGHQVAYLDRLNLPAMFSQQVTDVGALLVEP